MEVTPLCKYGHGLLKLDTGAAEDDSIWGLESYKRFDGIMAVGKKAFTVSVFVCPTCGYIELFDEGRGHNDGV